MYWSVFYDTKQYFKKCISEHRIIYFVLSYNSHSEFPSTVRYVLNISRISITSVQLSTFPLRNIIKIFYRKSKTSIKLSYCHWKSRNLYSIRDKEFSANSMKTFAVPENFQWFWSELKFNFYKAFVRIYFFVKDKFMPDSLWKYSVSAKWIFWKVCRTIIVISRKFDLMDIYEERILKSDFWEILWESSSLFSLVQ